MKLKVIQANTPAILEKEFNELAAKVDVQNVLHNTGFSVIVIYTEK